MNDFMRTDATDPVESVHCGVSESYRHASIVQGWDLGQHLSVENILDALNVAIDMLKSAGLVEEVLDSVHDADVTKVEKVGSLVVAMTRCLTGVICRLICRKKLFDKVVP